mmetsp:Transcript_42825/g.85860  ORF Transcript_42825/g.85860 Transcript_42825/m.85860 type:complete len:119 (+) Transcript_42825:703-1059(+)
MVGRTAMSDKHTHRQSDEAREDTLSGERAKFTTTRRDAEEKTEEEDSVKGTDESTVDQNLYLPVMPSNPHVTVSPPVLLLVVCSGLKLTHLDHTLARKHVEGGEGNGGRLTRDRSSLP